MSRGTELLQDLFDRTTREEISFERAIQEAVAAAARGDLTAADADWANDRAREALSGEDAGVAFVWAHLAGAAAQELNAARELAYASQSLGQAAQALSMLDLSAEALRAAAAIFGSSERHRRQAAHCQRILAEVRLQQGGAVHVEEAADLLVQAEQAFTALRLEPDVARCQLTRAQILRAQGQYERAAQLLGQARATYAALGRSEEIPDCDYTLAQVRVAQGGTENLREAERLLVDAHRSNLLDGRARDWQLGWMAPALLARIVREVDADAALRYYDDAITVIEEVRARQSSRLGRRHLGLRTTHVYLEAAAVAASNGFGERAYGYLLGAKARETFEAVGGDVYLAQLPADERARLESLLEEERRLEWAILGPDWPGIGIGGAGPGGRGLAAESAERHRIDYAERDRALRDVKDRKQRLVDDLTRRFPEAMRGFAGRPASPEQVRQSLDEGELLLDFLVQGDGAWLFAVTRNGKGIETRNGKGIEMFELDGPKVAAALESLRPYFEPADAKTHAMQRRWRSDEMPGVLSALSGELLDKPDLLDKAAPLLRQASHVFLSPPTSRDRFPWHALRWPMPKQPHGLRRWPRLGEVERPFAILPSASLLPVLRSRRGRAGGRRSVWVVASDARPKTSPIPLTALEARWVAEPYRPDADGHLNARAAGSFERALVVRGQWAALHFSCHGGRLGLLLLGADGAERVLTPASIGSELQVQAPLVVLSACWSGLDEQAEVAEWLGLATAFISAAGARAVVVCLWPVADAAAPFFFRALHQAWAVDGLPIGAAVERARTVFDGLTWADVKREAPAAKLKGLRYRGVRGRGNRRREPADHELVFRNADQREVYQLIGDPTLCCAAAASAREP